MIRYLEESHGATTSNGRASEDAKYKDEEKELLGSFSHRTTGQRRTSDACTLSQPEGPADESYSGRTNGKYQMLDTLQAPDDRAPPDDRCHGDRTLFTEVRRLPDIRTVPSLRTSDTHRTFDACVRTEIGPEAHVPLRPHLHLRGSRL